MVRRNQRVHGSNNLRNERERCRERVQKPATAEAGEPRARVPHGPPTSRAGLHHKRIEYAHPGHMAEQGCTG